MRLKSTAGCQLPVSQRVTSKKPMIRTVIHGAKPAGLLRRPDIVSHNRASKPPTLNSAVINSGTLWTVPAKGLRRRAANAARG
jgi:hypothetical protein